MGKTRYDIQFVMSGQEANNIILSWLQANQYEFLQDEMGAYWQYYDVLTGYKGLEYQINGNVATFFAYIGKHKKPQELTGFVGALPKQAYVSDLQKLFICLQGNSQQQNMYNQQIQPQNNYQNQQINYNQQQMNYNQPITNMQQFAQDVDKKNGYFAIASLSISILSMLMVCCSSGTMFLNIMLVIFGIMFGVMGLKSSKKIMAIIGIILNSLAIIISLSLVLLSFS